MCQPSQARAHGPSYTQADQPSYIWQRLSGLQACLMTVSTCSDTDCFVSRSLPGQRSLPSSLHLMRRSTVSACTLRSCFGPLTPAPPTEVVKPAALRTSTPLPTLPVLAASASSAAPSSVALSAAAASLPPASLPPPPPSTAVATSSPSLLSYGAGTNMRVRCRSSQGGGDTRAGER